VQGTLAPRQLSQGSTSSKRNTSITVVESLETDDYEYELSLPQRTFRFLHRSQLRPRRVLEAVVDDPGVALLR